MRALLLVLLASCAVPDEIGVGLGASQYDYLGSGDSTWPLTDNTGNEFGAHVWASWQMRPQRMIMMRPEEALTFDTPMVAPQPIVIDHKDDKGGMVTEVADGAVKVADAVRNDSGLQWLAGTGLLVLLAFLAVKYWPRRKT